MRRVRVHHGPMGDDHARTSKSGIALTSGTTAPVLEAEVRGHMCLHGGRSVSRNELQVYLEGLCLTHVSSSMAAQVILMLLDLDPGVASCSTSRFINAITSPPSWKDLDCAAAPWGTPCVEV